MRSQPQQVAALWFPTTINEVFVTCFWFDVRVVKVNGFLYMISCGYDELWLHNIERRTLCGIAWALEATIFVGIDGSAA